MLLETRADRLELRRTSRSAPLLVHNAPRAGRPFLHPLVSPDGVGVVTEDRQPRHPWQHGLYFGLNNVTIVNNFTLVPPGEPLPPTGFWTEGLHEKNAPTDGTFHPGEFYDVSATDEGATWSLRTSWRTREGRELFGDRQVIRVSAPAGAAHYHVDLHWTIFPTLPLMLPKYPYGGLFLRAPIGASSRPRLLTSEGATSVAGAEGKRARWVGLGFESPERAALPEPLRTLTVTIFDHPSNPGHPLPWRVDGQYGIGPSPMAERDLTLRPGSPLTLRHRVTVSVGKPAAAEAERCFEAFSQA